jgi:uncharacterized membrane protein YraQ (UPF0718 family)
MAVLQLTLHTFLYLLLEAVPLFLLGAVLGAALETWLKPGWIERWIGSGHRSVTAAALAGAVLPGCAMSTMPLAQSLRCRGAALGSLTAFIMIAPILSPHTIFLTATLVSVPMAIGRVVLSLAVTLVLGAVLNAMERRGRLAPAPNLTTVDLDEPRSECASMAGDNECCATEPSLANGSPWRRFLEQLCSSVRSLTPYLLGGLFVAALISATVPADTIHKYLRGGWTAYFFAALVAFPIYVCDGGEIPLTRALLAMGVGPGPAFCFMLASVGTCLPTIAMAMRIIGWRATIIYVVAWLF